MSPARPSAFAKSSFGGLGARGPCVYVQLTARCPVAPPRPSTAIVYQLRSATAKSIPVAPEPPPNGVSAETFEPVYAATTVSTSLPERST